MAFFSIIVPVYNIEKYIAQCLDSILSQTYRDYEVIIVDDGATDDSARICDEYEKKEVRCRVIHKKNSGLSAARNDGIRSASGEYIIFLDGDDWFEDKDNLSALHRFIENNNQPEVILNLFCSCVDGTNIVKRCNYDFNDITANSTMEQFVELLHCTGIFLGAQAFVVNRKSLYEKELFFKEGIFHEDNLWIAQVFLRCNQICLHNHSIFCYRVEREGSIMFHSSLRKLKDQFDIMDILSEEAKFYDVRTRELLRVWFTKIYKAVLVKLFLEKIEPDKELLIKLRDNKGLLLHAGLKGKALYVPISLWIRFQLRN